LPVVPRSAGPRHGVQPLVLATGAAHEAASAADDQTQMHTRTPLDSRDQRNTSSHSPVASAAGGCQWAPSRLDLRPKLVTVFACQLRASSGML